MSKSNLTRTKRVLIRTKRLVQRGTGISALRLKRLRELRANSDRKQLFTEIELNRRGIKDRNLSARHWAEKAMNDKLYVQARVDAANTEVKLSGEATKLGNEIVYMKGQLKAQRKNASQVFPKK